jgi:predicted AAA+ superfamily ATPase
MTVFSRELDLQSLLQYKSVLLLGPRSTGKSYYIKNQLNNIHYINLLRSSEFLLLSGNRDELENICKQHPNKIICIDEIQKIPELLDTIHSIIEEDNRIFLLTGSSARKLRATGVNLLAGRAWNASMYPLSYFEILNQETFFDLEKYLTYGSLPQVWNSPLPIEDLESYVHTYIEQELKAEGIIRKIPAFSRFLKAASLTAGELLNYKNISSDAQVPASTIKEHYQVLEDTLIGHTLHPWTESKKRKAIATGKFYFFDTGVLNLLSNQYPENENNPIWGNRFEHFLINELKALHSYKRTKHKLHYWRSTAGHEVDLIINDTAFEIKASTNISQKHLKGLKALQEENIFKHFVLLSRDKNERIIDGIQCRYFETYLKEQWDK